MLYNTQRSKTANKDRNNPQTANPKEKLINLQKREKLKGLLITKFMKKYGIANPEKLLEDEITKFLEGEKLTAADLERLDLKIQRLLQEKQSTDNLKRNLTQEPNSHSESIYKLGKQQPQPQLNAKQCADVNKGETMSVYSKMSGASNLSKFNEKEKLKFDKNAPVDDEDENEYASHGDPVERLDFSQEGDEWNAIAQYNKRKFEEERKMEILKDKEIKRRTKEDLDNQIKHKLKKEYEEQLKAKEYDNILLNHLDYLGQLEVEKQNAMKQKVLQEKENRDKQLKDEKNRKRTEILKDKKYDKELVKHVLTEMEKEKQMMLQKKLDENAALQKTLKDNELNKIRQKEALKKEREDDVRACEEYGKVLDRQENERIEYFKKIERSSNNFMTKMVDTVLKDMDNKNKEEEEQAKKYMNDQEKRAQEEDERNRLEEINKKKMMRSYLDMQVEEKRKTKEFEKTLDSEQARIWKTDVKKFHEQEKEINGKVRNMHELNAGYLKDQIETRKMKNRPRMTDTEYALNRKLLESAKQK